MDNTGTLNWRLSSHPITLCTFLAFRLASIFTYLFGLWFSQNFVLIFIIVMLLLAADFYYCKNIAGRRLVGLRWWNEATEEGDSKWVFESSDGSRQINATDSRFFWTALYAAPVLWALLAIVAIVRFEFIWLSLVVIAVILCSTNGAAFSRADKFGNASSIAGRALNSGAGSLASRAMGGLANRMMFGGRS